MSNASYQAPSPTLRSFSVLDFLWGESRGTIESVSDGTDFVGARQRRGEKRVENGRWSFEAFEVAVSRAPSRSTALARALLVGTRTGTRTRTQKGQDEGREWKWEL